MAGNPIILGFVALAALGGKNLILTQEGDNKLCISAATFNPTSSPSNQPTINISTMAPSTQPTIMMTSSNSSSINDSDNQNRTLSGEKIKALKKRL